MGDNEKRLDNISKRIEDLVSAQNSISNQIRNLREEVRELKRGEEKEGFVDPVHEEQAPIKEHKETEKVVLKKPSIPKKKKTFDFEIKSDIEKFIGENLINKIGIIITVLGVGIGAKYAIDNEFISPLTRIILGYVLGSGLMLFAMKLKQKYEKFSSVLLSGSLAIMYFISFAAYSFYGLFPQTLTFVIMFMLTVFTVFSSLKYNQKIIAHLGLVGAYAVPFLISNGSGKIEIMFTYMLIVNAGILIIAFKRYWKSLFYSAFGFTWVIFLSWLFSRYDEQIHSSLAMSFALIYYVLFYAMFISYKLIRSEKLNPGNVSLLLMNSFIFYGAGLFILDSFDGGDEFKGLFTLGNAFVHFVVSTIIYKRKLAEKNVFYLVSGLVLTFITISIPVQLDGNWVTLLWACEALILLWIGRTKGVSVYEKLSYPLVVLSTISFFQDWGFVEKSVRYFDPENMRSFLVNSDFLYSVIFIGIYVLINLVHRRNPFVEEPKFKGISLANIIKVVLPSIMIISIYFTLYMEIHLFWAQQHEILSLNKLLEYDSFIYSYHFKDINFMKRLSLIIFSLFFTGGLTMINNYKVKNNQLAKVNIFTNTFAVFVFLISGLYYLSELRDLTITTSGYQFKDMFFIQGWIRYVLIGVSIFAVHQTYMISKKVISLTKKGRSLYRIGFVVYALWLCSAELIHWMTIINADASYKLGLSLLWGMFSLGMIIFGINKGQKEIRILAFVLFGITLLKLFFYDIAHLSTISKTIVMVSLGVILLVVSFLYNKFKNQIVDENEE